MKIIELVDLLKLKVFSGKEGLYKEVKGAYTSDLLSDVIGNICEGQLWVTLQTHRNIMAIASLKEVSAIILVKGLKPEIATIEMSEDENIPILGTNLETFEISGRLYEFIN